jgi:C-terminal processing protease CtpA/Prc
MKAAPYIQAIEDCIRLLNEIQDLIYLETLNVHYTSVDAEETVKVKIESMLARLNDLKVDYYFQKDMKNLPESTWREE